MFPAPVVITELITIVRGSDVEEGDFVVEAFLEEKDENEVLEDPNGGPELIITVGDSIEVSSVPFIITLRVSRAKRSVVVLQHD